MKLISRIKNIIFILLFPSIHCFSQDSTDINKKYILAKSLESKNPDSSILVADNIIQSLNHIDRKNSIETWIETIHGKSLLVKGNAFRNLTRYSESIENIDEAIKIFRKAGLWLELGQSYNNMAIIYRLIGSSQKAIEYYKNGLYIFERLNYKKGLAVGYINLGILYNDIQQIENAKKMYFKAVKSFTEVNDLAGLSSCYNNLGTLYDDEKKFALSLDFYKKSLSIKEEIGDTKGKSMVLQNMAVVYKNMKNFIEARRYYFESLALKRKINDINGIIIGLHNVSEFYLELKKYDSTSFFLEEASKILNENPNNDLLITNCLIGKNYFKATGQWKKYIDKDSLFMKAVHVRDSIEQEQLTQELLVRYDVENKQKEIEKKQLQLDIQEKEIQHSIVIRNSLMVGIAMAIILLYVLYSSYRQKRKSNKLLQKQKNEIEIQKGIIEKNNLKITDSIRYAKRIQEAMLPLENKLSEFCIDYFILYEPKDIVSGDFFWIEKTKTEQGEDIFLFSAVDCTGHGVPGAFMSVLALNILHQALKEKSITSCSEILNFITIEINRLLQLQDKNNGVKDGMDIAVCAYNPVTRTLEYAGVGNSAYIVRKGQLIELKAEKHPIGMSFNEDFSSYSHKEILIEKDDCIYLFSDGYIDQKGGDNKKRFTSKQFKLLLSDIHQYSMDEQKTHLKKTFEEWKSSCEQYDDVLVMGVKF